jgi:hypothetical protein
MSQSNPYTPPSALITDCSATEVVTSRKQLIPLWIKIFGWLFMAMGVAVPLLAVVMAALGQPASYEMFGLRHQGSPFHPMALLISTIILSLAVSAYGLLFGRSWGLNACLVTGYGGVAICLGTMAYSLFSQGSLTIRLELLLQVPYLLKLHKIKPLWLTTGQRASERSG